MPPDSTADYDAQLERSIRKLKDLQDNIEIEIVMIYCARDIPDESQLDTKISPQRIYEDLKAAGFKMLVLLLLQVFVFACYITDNTDCSVYVFRNYLNAVLLLYVLLFQLVYAWSNDIQLTANVDSIAAGKGISNIKENSF